MRSITRALILAAGKGTRLRPLTLDRPKPMLPINGRPLLEHTISWLCEHGIQEIAINLHHRPEAIIRHLGDGASLGARIIYSQENPILGTAGAVRRLAGFLAGDPFLVVYGDVLTDLPLDDLIAFHRAATARDPAALATLSLYRVPDPTEVGIVDLAPDGHIVRFVEKPRPEEAFTDLANAGIMVLDPRVIPMIPPDTYYDFGQHLFPRLLASGASLYGWVIPEGTYLLDIGTRERYERAQREWPRRLRTKRHSA